MRQRLQILNEIADLPAGGTRSPLRARRRRSTVLQRDRGTSTPGPAVGDVVVQLPGQPRALFFLRFDQTPAHHRQGFFGELALRDVEPRADVAGKRAIRVEPRDALVEDPAVHGVTTPEPVFQLERHAPIEGRRIDLHGSAGVFRVDGVRPVVSAVWLSPARPTNSFQA